MVVVVVVMMEVIHMVVAGMMVGVGSGGCDGERLIAVAVVTYRFGRGGNCGNDDSGYDDDGGGSGGGGGGGDINGYNGYNYNYRCRMCGIN
ncbi:hypothetical protein HAX54_028274 [Datura stramonium]|uniref:Uncharacterized protein n=1 Tax=Datura stramonium TaxID=4076 RepID=A0ABS8S9F6_DATST|nr:hypothetical protein [Datura stramonium]